MSPSPSLRRPLLIFGVIAVIAVAAVAGYWLWSKFRHRDLPQPGSPEYEQYVEVFQVGVAALDGDVQQTAEEKLTRAIELIPEEPAAWANRGLLFLRYNRLNEAGRDLEQADRLAPYNTDIQKLLGLLAQRRGQYGEAAAYLRRAAKDDPHDVETLYRLAQVIDQEQQEGGDAEYQRLMDQILLVQPNNLKALVDRLRVSIRRSDRDGVKDTLTRLKKISAGWSKTGRAGLAETERALTGQLGPDAVSTAIILENNLKPEPGFALSYAAVNPETLPGTSLQTFLRLAPVRASPAPPDTELAFTSELIPAAPAGNWKVALPVWLTGQGQPVVFVANAEHVRQVGTETTLASMPLSSPDSFLALDWNNDFRTDLLVAGKNGLRFYQQQIDGSFADVTEQTKLPKKVLQDDYYGAWAADVDLDADLDIILARRSGPPLLLRNNFDGTFTPLPIFPQVSGARAFVWADLDHDGAADAALLDSDGHLHVYANERSGQFSKWPAPPPSDRFLALAVADADDDGVLDLIALRADGVVVRISDRDKRSKWDTGELAHWDAPLGDLNPGEVRLLAADFDNNGALDLLASSPAASQLWLGSGGGKFEPLSAKLPPRLFAAADMTGNGRLDLLGLDDKGRPMRLLNAGKTGYHWQSIRPRAAQVQGDNRINSFGLGGEIELRTGTHVVKQPINSPVVHFGLGERTGADVWRIVWPNGTFQVEFDKPIDGVVTLPQRDKTSCPYLFTWNGERFVFVADFMWSTPLGMYIQAQDKGGFLQTTEWVKIRGDQLVPRDGYYEVRATANLWETHFFDHLSLRVIDHPADREMFVDERFHVERHNPELHLTEPPHPVARAWDHHGCDATAEVRAIDGVYLDRCGRGVYRGLTNDHWVEVDLGDDAPRTGPVYLLATGWVHPTDSSINFALEQGKHDMPQALVLEVPDPKVKGGWRIGRDKLGFPAGKNKTIVIRLDGIDGPGVCRRFRLRTNMEIFWDALQYAQGRDSDTLLIEQTLQPTVADLRFRGFLETTHANAGSPKLPNYDRILSRRQHWRDLIGYHTRYGDVRELLEKIDDRYVILCGGDEIVLRFKAPPPPKPGWKRDFVWVSDGWVKDGDLNTRFGKTVLPLPAHDLTSYLTPPGRLQDDPVYRRHARDWEVYHTRYVTPDVFERGLRSFREPQKQK
jgi:Tfp pilus assembly protein PilF